MSVRIDSVEASSGMAIITCVVVGDAGEQYDCAGRELGSFELRVSLGAGLARMVAMIRLRAAEVYLEGYQSWVLRNELALELGRSEGAAT